MHPDTSAQSVADCRNPADGTRIRLHVSGRGEPLLLVHGWTLDHRSFAPQAPLAAHYRLVSYDRRGCGESLAAPNLVHEIGDIDAIIDALGGAPVHLLGVSQGARIALRYAARSAHRLRSLILQGAVIDGYTAPVEDEGAIPLGAYREMIERGQIDAMREAWLAHPLMASDDLDREQAAALREMVDGYRGTDLVGPPPTAGPANRLEQLRDCPLPTLLITGERETAARKAHAQKLLETLPDARERVLPDCGHLSNLSQAASYNGVVLDFLNALGPPQESS
jgi:pimeloyl-ACP methyl ester carboxylesterase